MPPADGSRVAGLRVLVIIPAYNEEATVGRVVEDVRRAMPGATPLVIDDGSSDRTAAVARAAGARVASLPFNGGIGTAVQTGFIVADREGFDVAVQVDGDGQHPANEVTRLLDEIATGSNYVIGSRFLGTGSYRATFARRRGISMLSWLISRLAGQRITDSTSGLRAADRRTIHRFAAHYPHDYPEVEAVVLARRSGLSVREVPVEMRDRQDGRSSITPIRSIYYMVKVTVAVLIQFIGREPRDATDA